MAPAVRYGALCEPSRASFLSLSYSNCFLFPILISPPCRSPVRPSLPRLAHLHPCSCPLSLPAGSADSARAEALAARDALAAAQGQLQGLLSPQWLQRLEVGAEVAAVLCFILCLSVGS